VALLYIAVYVWYRSFDDLAALSENINVVQQVQKRGRGPCLGLARIHADGAIQVRQLCKPSPWTCLQLRLVGQHHAMKLKHSLIDLFKEPKGSELVLDLNPHLCRPISFFFVPSHTYGLWLATKLEVEIGTEKVSGAP